MGRHIAGSVDGYYLDMLGKGERMKPAPAYILVVYYYFLTRYFSTLKGRYR